MDLAAKLVSGVDVWLNTPLRPLEASGTSGMKAAHNGVINFGILDGWWIEGWIEGVTGWAIGPQPNENVSVEECRRRELDDLYNKLENIIVPMFYSRRDEWIKMMKGVNRENRLLLQQPQSGAKICNRGLPITSIETESRILSEQSMFYLKDGRHRKRSMGVFGFNLPTQTPFLVSSLSCRLDDCLEIFMICMGSDGVARGTQSLPAESRPGWHFFPNQWNVFFTEFFKPQNLLLFSLDCKPSTSNQN